MATLGELITRISRRLVDENNTAVSKEDIRIAVNEAIQFWKNERYYFNELEYDTNFVYIVSGDPTSGISPNIPLPSNFLMFVPDNGVTVIDSKERIALTPIQVSEYNILNTEGNGLPSVFTNKSGTYAVYPYPQELYDLKLVYLKDYTDFNTDGTQDTSSNDFTIYAESLIRSEALARLHAELRQDANMANVFKTQAQAENKNLKKRNTRQKRTGTLTIH